ncbi:MAG: FKBP-type peptidyl-prolyl cis-trans isomerase [Bacteroidetes bacterium]|nr:FKBP-type peptidyl-prolyl cis-trans isomerase [Bacteroidota bacterium]
MKKIIIDIFMSVKGENKALFNVFLLFLSIFTLYSCNNEDYDSTLKKQKTSIESYLKGKNYEYNIQNGAYVYIEKKGVVGSTTIKKGDILTFDYSEYFFENKDLETLITTNIPEIATEAGLNTPEEDLKPIVVEYGVTPMVIGLERALKWVTPEEELIVYLPFTLAYGEKWYSVIAPYSPIAFKIKIIKIEHK